MPVSTDEVLAALRELGGVATTSEITNAVVRNGDHPGTRAQVGWSTYRALKRCPLIMRYDMVSGQPGVNAPQVKWVIACRSSRG